MILVVVVDETKRTERRASSWNGDNVKMKCILRSPAAFFEVYYDSCDCRHPDDLCDGTKVYNAESAVMTGNEIK